MVELLVVVMAFYAFMTDLTVEIRFNSVTNYSSTRLGILRVNQIYSKYPGYKIYASI